MSNTFKVLGINVSLYSIPNILEIIENYINNLQPTHYKLQPKLEKPLVIFTPNPEIVVYSQKDKLFKEVVNKAQINIPDGAGVVWAGKLSGYPIIERIAGADLAQKLVVLAEKKQVTIGLIGGFSGLAVKAIECLTTTYPRLKGWGENGPDIKLKTQNSKLKSNKRNLEYGSWNIDEFISRVKERKTGILFVGFGFPKQEYFIDEISEKLDNIIVMAVGGTFNYWSGRIPRAPLWMQKLGVEWLYRLIKEPWRIKRQMAILKFILKVLRVKLKPQMSKLKTTT